MRVCFWPTSFSADIQAFAHHLSTRDGFEVVVAMDGSEAYRAEPVWGLLPFGGELVERARHDAKMDADVVVVDNHLPPSKLGARMLVLWHGFGWRVDDLSHMRKKLRKHVGSVEQPNPRFRWQAFGDWDRRYRIERSEIHADNVLALGSAYSDLLRPDAPMVRAFERSNVQRAYEIDLARPTVLMGLTWHHGGALGHWGDEATLLDRYADHLRRRGANLLVRMHDRHRYEARYVAQTIAFAARHSNVQVKFKSENPDSLVDLLVSDAMVSNYSSFLNAFYYTEKPTIHIDPVDATAGRHYYRKLRFGRVKRVRIEDPDATWKLSPEAIGGLPAGSFDEMLAATDRALDEPDCCRELARAFVREYVTQVDGRTCHRIEEMLRSWAGTGEAAEAGAS